MWSVATSFFDNLIIGKIYWHQTKKKRITVEKSKETVKNNVNAQNWKERAKALKFGFEWRLEIKEMPLVQYQLLYSIYIHVQQFFKIPCKQRLLLAATFYKGYKAVILTFCQ